VKAFAEFGHSSDRHRLLSDYLAMTHGASLVLYIDCEDPPNHFVACLAEEMGTLRMLYSFAMIRETLQQERNKNHLLADQVKASEMIY
jgi:hypothetical protein